MSYPVLYTRTIGAFEENSGLIGVALLTVTGQTPQSYLCMDHVKGPALETRKTCQIMSFLNVTISVKS